MAKLSVQQVLNACFDSTNNQLNLTAATGTKVGSKDDNESSQNILNSAYDSNTLRTLFTT